MYQVSNQKFGEFLSEIRKEKHMTQKELAERLFVSDKTVSKWERGHSFPNVTLLIPIAEVLGITVTELLTAKRNELNEDAVYITSLQDAISKRKKFWTVAFMISICVWLIETLLCFMSPISFESMKDTLFLSLMMIVFAGWLCIFAKDLLPSYYDENKIDYVSQGIFRIHMIGLSFHNGNWPYLLTLFRSFALATAVLLPAVCYITVLLGGLTLWKTMQGIMVVVWVLFFILVTYYIAKKYS